MDTALFFSKILPREGLKVLAELHPYKDKRSGETKQGWRYTTYTDFTVMAEAVAQFEEKNCTVYHACNSFGDWYIDPDAQKKRLRTQTNVVACRSLYDDIDVGKPGCYSDTKEALRAIKEYLRATNLPSPLVVYSGGGIHLYWPMTEDVTPAEWQALANMKRRAAMHFGLKIDTACDIDSARVLRPVGATNRKYEPWRAIVSKNDPAPSTPAALRAALAIYCTANNLAEPLSRPPIDYAKYGFDSASALAAAEYPKSWLSLIVDKCAQVAAFRNTGGGSEPEWYASLGLAKHCEDGEVLAHEWSAQHELYDPAATQQKLDRWSYGPTLCTKFESCAPSRCAGCQFKGKVKTPLQLGYKVESEAPQIDVIVETQSAEDDAPAVKETVSTTPPCWPSEGYRSGPRGISAMVTTDDVTHQVLFASPLFYPVERVRNDDGTYSLRMNMLLKGGRVRVFDIPTKSLADARSLKYALAAYEISIYNDKLAIKYMQDFQAEMHLKTDETNTYQQMGWNEDFTGFLIGNTLIKANSATKVRLSETSLANPKVRAAYHKSGDAETWVTGVNTLYNREHGEPYQYAICTAFGSVLVPLLGRKEWNGIPLALTSDDSGFGKSTVAMIAINALCDSSKTTVADTTAKAMVRRASDMGNLVTLFDEVTKSLKEAEDMSDVLYALSNGQPREGLNSDGTARKSALPFKLNTILTGNKNILFQLTEAKNNPEATQMRVFEVNMELYPRMNSMTADSHLHTEHQLLAADLVDNHTGVLAERYIQYILNHMGKIKEKLEEITRAVFAELGGAAAKERFYAYHIACTIMGGILAKKLGFIDFDLVNLRVWAFNHVKILRNASIEYASTTQDRLAAMLADLHGTFIVTKHFETLSARTNQTEHPVTQVRNPISGRIVLGSDLERFKCYITVQAINDWCRKVGISAVQFRRALLTEKLVRPPMSKGRTDTLVSIGRGVPSTTLGQARCLEFERFAVQGYVDDHIPKEAKIIELQQSRSPIPTNNPDEARSAHE